MLQTAWRLPSWMWVLISIPAHSRPRWRTLIYYEEPNFPGTLAIGFDIYDGGEEANPDYIDEVDPDGCGGDGACLDSRANHISVHWDGAIVGKAVRLDPAEFDLVNGQWNDVTVLAEEVEGGMNVTVAIEDADGNAFLPFSDYFVEGASFPNGARAAFGGRTGGSTVHSTNRRRVHHLDRRCRHGRRLQRQRRAGRR